MKQLRVDIWSDVVCPWCYVGKRRFEAAVAEFSHGDAIDVVWRAFELDAAAPRTAGQGSYAEQLASKYGTSPAKAEEMIQQMTSTAASEGLELHFDRLWPSNTFDAHRLLHLASARGVQEKVNERLLRGSMTEGRAVGEPEVLVRLAVDAGLDEQETRTVLASDVYGDDVRADEAEAQAIGIDGVPFFVLGARYAVAGAQPKELLAEALKKAWESVDDDTNAGWQNCAPEGC